MHQAEAATYYVDPVSGSNSNAGTSTGLAWQNIPGAYDTGNTGFLSGAGWKRIVGGDTIIVKSGTTVRNRLIVNSSWYTSGTATQPIVITRDPAWGSGPVTIDGTGSQYGSWDALVFVHKIHNVVLDGVTTHGFVVQNSGAYGINAAGGGESARLQGLVLKNIKLFNNRKFNAMIQSCENFLISNVHSDGNKVNTQESGGFHIGGDNSGGCTNGVVINSSSYNHGAVPGSQAGGSDALQGFWLANSTNVTFKNCVAYNNAGRGFDIGVVSPVTVVTDNIKVIGCESYNNAAGFGCNLDNVSGSAEVFFLNSIARNNAIGLNLYEGPSVYVYNSLVSGNGTGIYVDAPVFSNRATYVELRNTIFNKNANSDLDVFQTAGLLNRTIVSDNNHWEYGGRQKAVFWNDVSDWDPYFYDSRSAPGSTSRSYYVNHKLDGNSTCSVDGLLANFVNEGANDYRPTARSGYLKRGQAIRHVRLSEAAYDKDGNPRPAAGWDIGPYQFTARKPSAPGNLMVALPSVPVGGH